MVKDRETCARFGDIIPDPEIKPGSSFVPVLRCFFSPHSEMNEAEPLCDLPSVWGTLIMEVDGFETNRRH